VPVCAAELARAWRTFNIVHKLAVLGAALLVGVQLYHWGGQHGLAQGCGLDGAQFWQAL
jgi:hypothetical protein